MCDERADETERQMLSRRGLILDENRCEAAMFVGFEATPSILASEYQGVAERLAARLEQAQAQRDEAIREGYNLRDELSRVAQGLEYLAKYHPLTDAQREMVAYLLGGDG